MSSIVILISILLRGSREFFRYHQCFTTHTCICIQSGVATLRKCVWLQAGREHGNNLSESDYKGEQFYGFGSAGFLKFCRTVGATPKELTVSLIAQQVACELFASSDRLLSLHSSVASDTTRVCFCFVSRLCCFCFSQERSIFDVGSPWVRIYWLKNNTRIFDFTKSLDYKRFKLSSFTSGLIWSGNIKSIWAFGGLAESKLSSLCEKMASSRWGSDKPKHNGTKMRRRSTHSERSQNKDFPSRAWLFRGWARTHAEPKLSNKHYVNLFNL